MIRPPSLATVRVRLAREILKKVAGPDMDEVRDRIHRTPGPRLFPPGSPIRRVNADASMYIGGIRALLLQSLHPMPMAAVVEHSGYRGDPWGRLARTAGFIASTTFGNEEEAANAIARVRRVHEFVNGVTPEGVPYTATDPDLVRFIHVAGVDSFLSAYQRYGAERLTPAECDTYVAQAATVALRLGATRAPVTVRELRADMDEFRPALRATPGAFSVLRFILLSAPVPLLARLALRPARSRSARPDADVGPPDVPHPRDSVRRTPGPPRRTSGHARAGQRAGRRADRQRRRGGGAVRREPDRAGVAGSSAGLAGCQEVAITTVATTTIAPRIRYARPVVS